MITWTSDGKTVIINGKWRSSLPDLKDCRGADCASDKTLSLEVISLKLCKTRKGQQRARLINSDKLRDKNIKAAYSLDYQQSPFKSSC